MKASEFADQLRQLVAHTGVDPEIVEDTRVRGVVPLVMWIHFHGAYVRCDEYFEHFAKYDHLGAPTRITVSTP